MPSKAAKAARSAKRAAKHIVPTLGPGTAAGTNAANSTAESLCDVQHDPSDSSQPSQSADIPTTQPAQAPTQTRNTRRSPRRNREANTTARGQRSQKSAGGEAHTRSTRRLQPTPAKRKTHHSPPCDALTHQECSETQEFIHKSQQQQEAGMTFKENLIDMQSYIHALDKDARIIMSANSKAMFEVLCLLSLDDPPSDPDQRLAYEQLVHTKVNRILKSQRQRCSRRERRRQARAQPASQSQNQSKSNQVKSQIHI